MIPERGRPDENRSDNPPFEGHDLRLRDYPVTIIIIIMIIIIIDKIISTSSEPSICRILVFDFRAFVERIGVGGGKNEGREGGEGCKMYVMTTHFIVIDDPTFSRFVPSVMTSSVLNDGVDGDMSPLLPSFPFLLLLLLHLQLHPLLRHLLLPHLHHPLPLRNFFPPFRIIILLLLAHSRLVIVLVAIVTIIVIFIVVVVNVMMIVA